MDTQKTDPRTEPVLDSDVDPGPHQDLRYSLTPVRLSERARSSSKTTKGNMMKFFGSCTSYSAPCTPSPCAFTAISKRWTNSSRRTIGKADNVTRSVNSVIY